MHYQPTDVKMKLHIRDSAVALHCCKTHAKINRKMENSTPCEIVPPKNITLQLCTRDCSIQSNPFVDRHNVYQPKGGDALRLGSKGRYGLCVAGKTV